MNIRKLTYTELMIAVGILLPQIFHMLGGTAAGGTFLPMHIPVLLAGLLLGPVSGAAAGVLCPVLSCFLTGMPPLAMLPFMLLELAGYGAVSGLAAKNWKLNSYVSLLLAMAAGRLVNALALVTAAFLFHLQAPPVVSVWTAVLTGIPGILIQLVFIPAVVAACRKVVALHDRA